MKFCRQLRLGRELVMRKFGDMTHYLIEEKKINKLWGILIASFFCVCLCNNLQLIVIYIESTL